LLVFSYVYPDNTNDYMRLSEHSGCPIKEGEKIIATAGEVLNKVSAIQSIAQEFTAQGHGSLNIATTHTQSRYILPQVIKSFINNYPDVSLNMHQGTPMQISQMASDGTADFAIATEALELFTDLVMMPCFHWNRAILVPRDHPLCHESKITLASVAAFPIVTYVYGFTGRSKLDEAFQKAKQHKDTYGIKRVQPPNELHGDYSFYMLDRDGNWWEIQCIENSSYDENFEYGDVA